MRIIYSVHNKYVCEIQVLYVIISKKSYYES